MTGFRLIALLKILLAAVVLDGFTLALAMEASPELHHKIHHDADDGDHDCLATQLHAGGCDSFAAGPLLMAPCEVLWSVAVPSWNPQWVAPLFLTNSVLEHAPPALV